MKISMLLNVNKSILGVYLLLHFSLGCISPNELKTDMLLGDFEGLVSVDNDKDLLDAEAPPPREIRLSVGCLV